jgi:predicted GNAT superfamily acetyltransferase
MTSITGRPLEAAGVDLTRAGADAAAGVRIELVTEESAARDLTATLGRVWKQPPGSEPLGPELAWALAHCGNYVAVARDRAGTVVAGAVGFRGADQVGPYLHSHIVGVVDAYQGAGVGLAVKHHQRSWALAAGLDRMTWTFDPLIARNAYFNVMKLRARITSYYVNFYGAMDDGFNSGDESDRCLVTWCLTDNRPAEMTDLSGAVEVLSVGPDQQPVLQPAVGSRLWLASVPPDVIALRQERPELAHQWRLALRQVLGGALGDSRPVLAVTRQSGYLIGPLA